MVIKSKCIIFFLAFVVMAASAQTMGGEITRKSSSKLKGIERNIDGVIIGLSTKEDVTRLLKTRKISYDLHEPANNYNVIVANGKFKYQGVEWQAVMYKLYENKVFVIVYIKGVDKDKINSLILTSASLNKAYSNKYKKYQMTTKPGIYQYQDPYTFITIELGEHYDELSLGIGDVEISKSLNN